MQPGPFHAVIFKVVEEVHQGDGGTGRGGREWELRGGRRQPGLYPIPISPIHNAIALGLTAPEVRRLWRRLLLPLVTDMKQVLGLVALAPASSVGGPALPYRQQQVTTL